MSNGDKIEGRCNAQTRDGGYCANYPVDGANRCRMHGGTNQGAPEGNDNSQKHALHADRGLFYDRLDDDKQRQIDNFESALIDRYQAYQGRDPDAADVKDLFEIAVGYVLRDYAREYMMDQMEESGNPLLEHVEMQKDGEEVEFDKPNELLEKIEGNRKEDRMQRKDKGLEKDPESRKADAMEDGFDLHLTAGEKVELEATFDRTPDI